MIENLRGRSTETKYGRVPLWLYETGVSLQAIATYGWLHGRYGHYERVMPSYATLAKELGVSRGSVIAYVKELVRVGAVRIETSGAAGRQTNAYVIAFNEPFEVTGQNADRGGQDADPVVSGVHSSGQRADWGGQRAVQEEDVFTQTQEDDLSPPPVPDPQPEPVPAVVERETTAAPDKPSATTAERVVRAANVVTPAEEAAFITWATDYYSIRSSGLWHTVATNGDLAADWVPTWRAQHAPAPAQPALPPACGPCLEEHPAAQYNPRLRTQDGQRCSDCHPGRIAA